MGVTTLPVTLFYFLNFTYKFLQYGAQIITKLYIMTWASNSAERRASFIGNFELLFLVGKMELLLVGTINVINYDATKAVQLNLLVVSCTFYPTNTCSSIATYLPSCHLHCHVDKTNLEESLLNLLFQGEMQMECLNLPVETNSCKTGSLGSQVDRVSTPFVPKKRLLVYSPTTIWSYQLAYLICTPNETIECVLLIMCCTTWLLLTYMGHISSSASADSTPPFFIYTPGPINKHLMTGDMRLLNLFNSNNWIKTTGDEFEFRQNRPEKIVLIPFNQCTRPIRGKLILYCVNSVTVRQKKKRKRRDEFNFQHYLHVLSKLIALSCGNLTARKPQLNHWSGNLNDIFGTTFCVMMCCLTVIESNIFIQEGRLRTTIMRINKLLYFFRCDSHHSMGSNNGDYDGIKSTNILTWKR
ncbi:hypothetical protein VP01_1037g4 [Puccinia sorghi]|uniref:Uncharacterized protein n=1 Tax=Puccinia sorghi TaxID=27349 RepID=A0A0L6VUG6_9BASI|nr:hypothetical protein VP01_1037g4 [Puccinia sorghi]